MQRPFFITSTFISLLILAACSRQEKDSVRQAHQQNLNSAIDEDISDYMTKAADSRMMSIEEGKLARTKATNQSIRAYGEVLMNTNSKMLHDLRVLAASKNIVLPNFLSNRNVRALEDLREKDGTAFDEALLRLMRKSYRRDIGSFNDAANYNDHDVQKFAANRLPELRTQLESIQDLESRHAIVSERSNSDGDN